MPKLTRTVPKYSKHRASGQAVVTIEGRDYYLGPHGTNASRLEYDRLIAEWLANGRRLSTSDQDESITVSELVAAYIKHQRCEHPNWRHHRSIPAKAKPVLSTLRTLYGKQPASEFGPLKLKAVRQKLVERGQW